MNREEPEINRSLVDPLLARASCRHHTAFLLNLNDSADDLYFEARVKDRCSQMLHDPEAQQLKSGRMSRAPFKGLDLPLAR